MGLPKLEPCQKCGNTPEWFFGWGGDFNKVCLTLYCNCRHIKTVMKTYAAFDESFVNEVYRRMERQWRKAVSE